MLITLKRNEIVNKINEVPNLMFSMVYIKKDGTQRRAVGRLHVSNPDHGIKPGQGQYKGQSGKEALEKYGNLKYYDMTAVDDKGQGAFRTAKLENILSLKVNGINYSIID